MLRLRHFALCALALGAFACRQPYTADEPPDASSPVVDAGVDAAWPLTDLVPAIGTEQALDIATWNIENFPKNQITGPLSASLILSLELDLIGVQEIADTDAFDEMMALLPGYDAILSVHTYGNGSYQKVGFIYRSDILRPGDIDLLFDNDGYAFPRPPLEVQFDVLDPDSGETLVDFHAVVVHLKAGIDVDDRARRRRALEELDDYVRARQASGDPDVVLLGDFNEAFDSADALAVWNPLLSDGQLYHVHTTDLESYEFSYVPWPRLLDHVVTTRSWTGARASETQIPRLDMQVNTYVGSLSDHLPVITSVSVFSSARRSDM